MTSKHSIPHYKLIYFPVRGRGEFIRYLFALAEVPYEEQIITFDEWPSKKPGECLCFCRLVVLAIGNGWRFLETPFGALPILEIDHGKHVLAQSVAIGRYLAKRFGMLEYAKSFMAQILDSFMLGLYGKDAVEQAQVDMYVDGCVDLYPKFAPYFEARIKGDHDAMVRPQLRRL